MHVPAEAVLSATVLDTAPIMRKALKRRVSSENTTDATSRPTRNADGSTPSATLPSWKAACRRATHSAITCLASS